MQVVEEEYEVKQMRDMAAARKRWEALVRDGKVKVLTPREAGYAIQLSNKTLLDVCPSVEHQKAWVKGSTWIPIFEVDDSFDTGTLSRKITGFMIDPLQLVNYCIMLVMKIFSGFKEVWRLLKKRNLKGKVPCPLSLSGIGGLSEFLGWTDQQRAAAAKEGWGYRLVFTARVLGLVIAADALFLGAQQFGHYLENLRSQ